MKHTNLAKNSEDDVLALSLDKISAFTGQVLKNSSGLADIASAIDGVLDLLGPSSGASINESTTTLAASARSARSSNASLSEASDGTETGF